MAIHRSEPVRVLLFRHSDGGGALEVRGDAVQWASALGDVMPSELLASTEWLVVEAADLRVAEWPRRADPKQGERTAA